MYHLWVVYFLKMVMCPACADSLSVCVIYSGAEHHGGSVAEGAVRVCCGSLSVVSQLADRPGPRGAAHQRSPIHQPDRPRCWKAGRGLADSRLARLTYETKTQCYRPASASLWCQSVLLIRDSLEGYLLCLYHLSRHPPHLLYVVVGADTALLEEKNNADVACWIVLKPQRF